MKLKILKCILIINMIFCNFTGEIGEIDPSLNGFTPALLSFLLVYNLNGEIMAKRIFKDGERFNSLVFVKELKPLIRKAKYGKNGIGYERIMLWKCDCGNYCKIRMTSVITGKTKTCGCLHKEVCRKMLTTHGLYYHPLRIVHGHMINRCYNIKEDGYSRYGGRGITVCNEWRESLEKFVKWAESNGYKKGLTIDRIDNDGNYTPSNCRFTDRLTQANNTRSVRWICYKDERLSLAQFCIKHKLNRKTTAKYLDNGYSSEYIVNKFKKRTYESA